MIDKFAVVAKTISPAKPVFALISVISVGFFVYYLMLSKASTGDNLIPPIVFFVWSYSAWAYINLFIGVPTLEADLGFLKRLKIKFMRSFYWVIALIFIASSLGVIMVTSRMLKVWL